MNKTAVITGVTGQDGSYLCDYLLDLNYTVIGLKRRSSTNNIERIKHIINNPNFNLLEFDLTDPASVLSIVDKYRPDEFYNLAAQSHVKTSFDQPTTTLEINTIGVVNILEAIRHCSKETKFYQASTSEMFGRNYDQDKNGVKYQDENTQFLPQSPYGVAKLASHRLVQLYRDSYQIFGCCGILFNHESPKRCDTFVTKKITQYIGQLVGGLTKDTLKLGNLSACRDWGHAKDYIEAMYLMIQQDNPDDFVISMEQTHSVLDFLKACFNYVNLDYRDYVEIDSSLYRPAEVDYLLGKSTKAREQLGWKPNYDFQGLVVDMMEYELKEVGVHET